MKNSRTTWLFHATFFLLSLIASMRSEAVTEHENEVTFSSYSSPVSGQTIKLGGLINVEYSITAGQPYSGVYLKNDQTLVVRAGRKGSTTPVTWLKSKGFPLGSNPADLNFAVAGDLVLNVTSPSYTGQLTCRNIALAQGHNGANNDWWLYSNTKNDFNDGLNYFHVNNKVLVVNCENGSRDPYYLFLGNSGVSAFFLRGAIVSRSTNDWMGKLPSSFQYLNQIALPGSHDAGMSEVNHCTVGAAAWNTRTQNRNILNQALAGSRYFDIRVDYDHDELWTYHRTGAGVGCSGQRLNDVLNNAVSFLSANPTETLILKFSHTRSDSGHSQRDIVERVVNLLTSSYTDYLYKSDNNGVNLSRVDLDSMRGKIIAVFDYEYFAHINPQQGIFSYLDYDPSYPTISANLKVYDRYSNSNNVQTMRSDQLSRLRNYGGLGKDYLFLLSWTLTQQVDDILRGRSIETLATVFANPALQGALDEVRQQAYPRPNIVYVDFINPSLSSSIINLNY